MDRALDQLSKVVSFKPAADEEPLRKELITLLAQRRELVAAATQHIWDEKLDGIPPELAQKPPTLGSMESERLNAQQEMLTLPYLKKPETQKEAMYAEMDAAGKFFQGIDEKAALVNFFTSRSEALMCERRMISQKLAQQKHKQLNAILSKKWDPGSADCGQDTAVETEEALIGRYMSVLLHGEADAAGRAARIKSTLQVTDQDWRAVALHVSSRAAPGRIASRLFARMRWIPYSHHHRFPLYEKLTLAAEERNARAELVELIFPPEVVKHRDDLHQRLRDISRDMDLSNVQSVASLGKFDLEFNPDDEDGHRAAYISRTALPEVLVRQHCLRPRVRIKTGLTKQNRSPSESDEEEAFANLPSIKLLMEKLEKVYLTDEAEDKVLEELVPSLDGGGLDEGHFATLRGEVHHIDEILRAESDYLDQWDVTEIVSRVQSLVEGHQKQWTDDYEASSDDELGETAEEGGKKLPLPFKKLEAFYTMRLMKSAQHKLQVLHHVNAVIAIRRQLLQDESEEVKMERNIGDSVPKDMNVPCLNGQLVEEAFATAKDADKSDQFRYSAHEAHGQKSVQTRDTVQHHPQLGVCVRNYQGQLVVYKQALEEFAAVEEELLKIGTYFLEKRAQTLEAEGELQAINDIDRLQVVMHLWEFEASFAASRQKTLDVYMEAYRHAIDWGLEDMWGEYSPADALTPNCMRHRTTAAQKKSQDDSGSSTAGKAKAQDFPTNSKIPGIKYGVDSSLGARKVLRREIVDLSYRRPGICVNDTYFCARYMQENLALDAEALLVRTLTEMAVEQEAALLVNSHISGAGVHDMADDGPVADVWELGLPPAMVMAPTLETGKGPAAMMKQLPVLTSAGCAAAALPSMVRETLDVLSDCHQIQGTVAIRELRFLVLQAAIAELQILRVEEGTRFQAHVSKPPRDSKFGSVKDGENPEFSWLAPSLAADSPIVFASAMREAQLGGLDAIKVALQREQLIRLLYETEVQYSVHFVQSAALGRRIQMQDCKGIDWESMDRDGKALRVETLEELEEQKDPSDPNPPGGGTGAGKLIQTDDSNCSIAHSQAFRVQPYFFAVGRAGNLGLITRAPSLAGLEFSTSLADGLETHSLAGLRRVFAGACSGNKGSNILLSAVRAQALRRVVTATCIKHNQVLLDGIIIAVERQRQVEAIRAARLVGKAASVVPNMHLGVDTSSVPGLRVPTGRQIGATRGLNRRVPENMTDRTSTVLMQFRMQLVKQVQGILLSPYQKRIDLFNDARKEFATRLKLRTAGNMQIISSSEIIDIKADLFNAYCMSYLDFLSPALLQLQAVKLTSQLARSLLGSAGGTGCDWGISQLSPFDTSENPHPAKIGPYFHGVHGVQQLRAAVLNYGPMWQMVDTDVDPDSAYWHNPRKNPGGCAFAVTEDGLLDTQLLWGLPRKWDVLGYRLEANGSTVRLEKGLEVLEELLGTVRIQISKASLMVRACHLASGGDMNPEVHGKGMQALGQARDIDKVIRTAGMKGPNVPGALMTQAFNRLQSELDGLANEAKGSTGPARPALADDALKLLRTQRQLSVLMLCTAIDRIKTRLTVAGPDKSQSWYKLRAIEHDIGLKLANGKADIGTRPLVLLPDVDRQALHNEQLRLELMVERALQENCIDTLRTPLAAMSGRIYCLGCAWLHDRCRDAFLWHAHNAEKYGLLLTSSAHTVAPFAKIFLDNSLQAFSRKMPLPEKTSHDQALYAESIDKDKQELLNIYPIANQNMAIIPGPSAASSDKGNGSSAVAKIEIPSDAWWNRGTVTDRSYEMREVEAGILAMKRRIDGLTLQRLISSLRQECSTLLGVSFRQKSIHHPVETTAASSSIESERPYSPLAPRSASSSRSGVTPASPLPEAHYTGPRRTVSSAGTRIVTPRLASPTGAFQFSGDYGLAQVQRLVRRLKGLKRTKGPQTFLTEQEQQESYPGCLIIPDSQLQKWLEEVFRAMYAEGGQVVSVAAQSIATEMCSMEQLSQEIALRLTDMESMKGEEDRKHRLNLETQVCNRGMDLLKALSNMRRQSLEMRDQADEALVSASEEAKAMWEGKVQQLERELMVARSNLSVVRNEMKQNALTAMAEVKSDAMRRLMAMRTGVDQNKANSAQRILDLEAEVQRLNKSVTHNESAVLKVRIMYQLKMMAFAQKCQRKVDEALRDMNAMEKRKWEVQEETRLERDLLEQQLKATQADLANAQGMLERTGKDLNRTTRNKNRLMKWKLDRKADYQQMKQRCTLLEAQKQRAVEKLTALKDTRVQAKTQRSSNASDSLVPTERSVAASLKHAAELDAVSKPLVKRVEELQKALSEERNMKGDLLLQCEDLKGQVQALQSIAAGMDPGKTGPKWGDGLQGDLVYKNRYEQLQSKHEEVARETQDLRYVVASLFNAAPDLFSTLEPNRLRRIGFIPNGTSSTEAKQVAWKPLSNPLRPKGEGDPFATHLAPKQARMAELKPSKNSGKSPGSNTKDRKSQRKSRASVASPAKKPVLGNPASAYKLDYRPTITPLQGSGCADSTKSLVIHRSQFSPRDEVGNGVQKSVTEEFESQECPRRLFTSQGRPISASQRNRQPLILGLRPTSAAPSRHTSHEGLAGTPRESRRPFSANPGSNSNRAANLTRAKSLSATSQQIDGQGSSQSLVSGATSLQQQYVAELHSLYERNSPRNAGDKFGPWG